MSRRMQAAACEYKESYDCTTYLSRWLIQHFTSVRCASHPSLLRSLQASNACQHGSTAGGDDDIAAENPSAVNGRLEMRRVVVSLGQKALSVKKIVQRRVLQSQYVRFLADEGVSSQ